MIQKYTIKSFEDIYSIGWLLTGWMFRGQADAGWRLESKVERVSASLDLVGPNDLERLAVERFQREAQQYVHHVPDLANRADWLAFLQHYGGPTRLLDFTKSIYIALFFAIEGSSRDAVVWAFNEGKIFRNLAAKTDGDETVGAWKYVQSHTRINLRQRHGVHEPGLLPVMPFWMSDRQSIQQGVFLFPEDLRQLAQGDQNPEGKRHVTFEDNLMAEFDLSAAMLKCPPTAKCIDELTAENLHQDRSIIKLVIPNERELRVHLIGELLKMNVTTRSLFPGLEGLARSYNYPFEGYEASRIWAKAFKPQMFRDSSEIDSTEPEAE